MSRSKSSKRWLQEHFNDSYVRQAQADGWRSRAAFKLLELDQRDQLLKPGMTVVDLGAAPGGWSQVLARRLDSDATILALDILPMPPLEGVRFIQGDFTEAEPLAELEAELNGARVDLVLSDMAPNLSGIVSADQARAMYLAELALDFAVRHLRPGGDLVVKCFQGEGFDGFLAAVRAAFSRVLVRKPGASRARSREVYILGRERRAD